MKWQEILRLIAGLAAAPAAWTAQMLISEPLVAQACYPSRAPAAAAQPGMTPALAALSIACLALALGGLWLAWRAWRCRPDPAGHAAALDQGTRPATFLALLGMMGSSLFSCAILFTSLALLLVDPCGKGLA